MKKFFIPFCVIFQFLFPVGSQADQLSETYSLSLPSQILSPAIPRNNPLTKDEVKDLVEFLKALTTEDAATLQKEFAKDIQ